MPRVLLIRPLCEGDELEFAEPLGIERLAGYLRAHGVEDVAIFDRRLYQRERRAGRTTGSFWSDVRACYASTKPDLVGVSIMTSADVPDALRVLSRVHALWPQARLEVGGLYVTLTPEEAERRLPSGVILTRGEGEAALLALVTGVDVPVRPLPTPDDWSMAYRGAPERYAALGCAVNMQTSRGCPGRCTFCATPRLPHVMRHWRPRSISLVVDEIEHEATRLEMAGMAPIFNFVDDDFGPLARVEALADELDRRGLRVSFALEMRLASLIGQRNLGSRLARLREAGLSRLFFGVESLNQDTLRRWRKGYDASGLSHVIEACGRAGVAVQAGYILWHRDQTIAAARREVEALWRLGIYSHRAALSRLIVFAGCAIAEESPDERGLQRMSDEAEAFYHRFSDATGAWLAEWTQAAIAEPYAAAEAFLTGDNARLTVVRKSLDMVNERSYELFMQMSSQDE